MGESLRDSIVAHISAPSSRDRQTSIGPSGLADPCDHCLARALHGDQCRLPPGFIPTWFGTAVHAWLEEAMTTYPGETLREVQVLCGQTDRLGPIRGTADLVLPEEETLIDWKILKSAGIRQIQRGLTVHRGNLILSSTRDGARVMRYAGQLHLYAAGLHRAGIPISRVVLAMIPKDSTKTLEAGLAWVEIPVQEGLAQAVIDRADRLADPDLDPEEVPSSPFCYECAHK